MNKSKPIIIDIVKKIIVPIEKTVKINVLIFPNFVLSSKGIGKFLSSAQIAKKKNKYEIKN